MRGRVSTLNSAKICLDNGVHFILVEKRGDTITGYVVEKLSHLQEKILTLLQIPKEIYNLSFSKVQVLKTENDNDLNVGLATSHGGLIKSQVTWKNERKPSLSFVLQDCARTQRILLHPRLGASSVCRHEPFTLPCGVA
jgi:hypothetical protein